MLGRRWFSVPILHDILRSDYWIYNEKIEGDYNFNGFWVKFFKFNRLPEKEEVELVEWRVIDLMNNFKYSHTSKEGELMDLVKALGTKKLNLEKFLELAKKYANEETKQMIKLALILLGQKSQIHDL